jgi:hypothetical protein
MIKEKNNKIIMGLYEKITKRKLITEKDPEFEVQTRDDFHDNMFRGYSQSLKYIRESEIIKDIEEKGKDYRTDENTTVKVGKRKEEKYIHSIPNGTTNDNILNLPTYPEQEKTTF